jgi:hypothetical protein
MQGASAPTTQACVHLNTDGKNGTAAHMLQAQTACDYAKLMAAQLSRRYQGQGVKATITLLCLHLTFQ